MNLALCRSHGSLGYTSGKFSIDGECFCYTLEDEERDEKAESTAIPTGRYRVLVTASECKGRDLPLLLDVPGYYGVRMYSGCDNPREKDGWILLGGAPGTGGVDTPDAVTILLDIILPKINAGEEIWLTIT